MGLTSSMYSGLSGLAANSQMLTVAGNNISNVNTTAFKGSRVNFETQFSQTLREGSGPTSESGGTNPSQVGLGTRVAAIQRDFTGGSVQPTGVDTDMAIQGDGFFTVNLDGKTLYTRDGSFLRDRDNNLVSASSGARVQGYGVDGDFNVLDGALTDVNIPIGTLTLAEPTGQVTFAGNLNAGGDVAANGTIIDSQPLFSDAAATIPATGADALNSLYDVAAGTPLFNTGDVITITGATRGGSTLPDTTFEVGPANTTGSDDNGTTLDDLMQFINSTFGIDEAVSGGVSLTGGTLTIEGNAGTANDLTLDGTNFVVNQGASPTTPLTLTKTQDADGESTTTSFVTYDSLGNESKINLSMVLDSKSDAGTTWRFFAQSPDDTDLDSEVGTGLLNFDTNGRLVSVSNDTITLNHTATGAATPQNVDLLFQNQLGSLTALSDTDSRLAAVSQDGSPIGTLQDFSVGADGTITGTFSNSLTRTLGRIPLATFANNQGLEEAGGNLYTPSTNSGLPSMTTATTGGAGKIVGQALELSNVDLSNEFVKLISASTGFSANSRVVTTSNQLIQELLNVIR